MGIFQGSSTPTFKVTALAEVVDHSVEATILRRIGLDKSCVPKGFGNPDFICEPLLWLYQMCLLKPQRGDFADEFEIPGRWVQAFTNALSTEYPTAPVAEQAVVRRHFEAMSREYFAWVALGRSENEGHRLLRHIEEICAGSRMVTDKWEGTRVGAALGKTEAEQFGRMCAGSRVRLSRRGTAALGSILKFKTTTTTSDRSQVQLRLASTGELAVTDAAETGGAIETAQTPRNNRSAPPDLAATTTVDASPRKRPGKRERAKSREFTPLTNATAKAPVAVGTKVDDIVTSPSVKKPIEIGGKHRGNRISQQPRSTSRSKSNGRGGRDGSGNRGARGGRRRK